MIVHAAEAVSAFAFDITWWKIAIAAFVVGLAVGITGMGGGALMTPALIFLGVGETSTVVTADLTAAAVYKSGGAVVHWREGSPNLTLAKWLMVGSVPTALAGPHVMNLLFAGSELEEALQLAIGFALLFAASTYAVRLYINLRRVRAGRHPGESDPHVRPIPTILVGALGGLLVGITSVGSGSVIMIALLMLYPTLGAVKLVGTDLVQAVPLVLAAAISNIAAHGLDLGLTVPLIAGSVPGSIIGAKLAPRVRASLIRRAVVIVLTMSGVALLDKAGWAPLGRDETHPIFVALVGLAMVVALPVVWGMLRRSQGLPMFGTPTYAQIEQDPRDSAYRARKSAPNERADTGVTTEPAKQDPGETSVTP